MYSMVFSINLENNFFKPIKVVLGVIQITETVRIDSS